jgi:hypothetical protein
MVQIMCRRKTYYGGCYATMQEPTRARLTLKTALFGPYARYIPEMHAIAGGAPVSTVRIIPAGGVSCGAVAAGSAGG